MYSGKLRHYQLDAFQIDFTKMFVDEKIDGVLGMGARNVAPLRLKYREYQIKRRKYGIEKETSPMECNKKVYHNEPAYYIGFWQSHEYFDEYYEDIKRQYQLKGNLSSRAKNI